MLFNTPQEDVDFKALIRKAYQNMAMMDRLVPWLSPMDSDDIQQAQDF